MRLEPRLCTRCKGSKLTISEGFTSLEGKVYPRNERPCVWCSGAGEYQSPVIGDIIDALTKGKPGNKTWCASKPAVASERTCFGRRVYYVWRLARFHGGKDCTLPMGAMMDIGGDPFEKELDALASGIARKVFWSDMRGAARWHYALTGNVVPGFVDGPTYDEHKPASERLETK